ncbi:GNAT family N-acetyltransferase [Phosphitispora fastidiosa]|uniref:GNAT family N-acetyltransferase n=1 Tax=Phosphitispora fastidiosa TaxID=2837202 RepID=UPI001E57D452|nr:GNAT family N-acetyltransferase [Phosphitispora fastidiosa]MBU7006990.1 hypothetical protein [Phosphitispora fastidiosa]
MKWITYDKIDQVPTDWDELAGSNIFLTRDFLRHLEKVNPCSQAYHRLEDHVCRPKAIYVDYTLKLDIFTYRLLSFKIPLRIMGIPCSVAKPGFSAAAGYENELWQHFQSRKGAKLILNCSQKLPGKAGNTLPACRLQINWSSFEEYLMAMRSSYRCRTNKAVRKWHEVQVDILPPSRFDQNMYLLYEAVYARSAAKLEKLSIGFFRSLTPKARLIRATYKEQLLGFSVIVENDDELVFLFTGFDYQLNHQFDIYYNLLLEILRFGIANNYAVIDFGQTAEETKLKLGAQLFDFAMYIGHSNPIINWAANRVLGALSYRASTVPYRVFKNRGQHTEN